MATGVTRSLPVFFVRGDPKGLASESTSRMLRVVGRVHEFKLGLLGVWGVQRDTGARLPWNLRPEAWTADPGGAAHWSTVTLVVFDRHPKAKDCAEYQREVAGMIAAACESIDLPRPREVIVTSVSAQLGVPFAHVFAGPRRKDDSERRCRPPLIRPSGARADPPRCGPVSGVELCRLIREPGGDPRQCDDKVIQ